MKDQSRWRLMPAATLVLVLLSGILLSAAQSDCTYLRNPEEYKIDSEQRLTARVTLTARVVSSPFRRDAITNAVDANSIPRKNFIDDAIFNRLAAAKIQPA